MKKTILAAVLALTLGACAAQDGTQTSKPATPMSAQPLVGTNWVLVRLGESPVVLTPGQREPFLQLSAADTRASGFAGCNMFAGPYQLSGEKLSFSPLAMTRMACAPGMSIEGGYANALRDTKAYKITGSQLVLVNDAGQALATFEAKKN